MKTIVLLAVAPAALFAADPLPRKLPMASQASSQQASPNPKIDYPGFVKAAAGLTEVREKNRVSVKELAPVIAIEKVKIPMEGTAVGAESPSTSKLR